MEIKIRVTGKAQEKARRADHEFDLLPERMVLTVRQSAEALRDGDTYQDRTGDLRASTKEEINSLGDPTMVDLVMGESYASFVKNLGFSDYDDVVETTIDALDEGMTAMRRRISGR